jgi:hypothetical protein
MWAFITERWGTLDTRTLGVFRIVFGLLLIGNLLDRIGFFGDDLVSFYTNDGIWPNHYALFLPPTEGYWSLLSGFSTPAEVRVAMAVILSVYVLFTLGWKTRLMQVLVLLAVESVNFRFLLPQHGGTVVMNIIAVWTLFLPLGDRFSLDALFRSLREVDDHSAALVAARPASDTVVKTRTGLAVFGIFFNFAAIYFFNTIHKGGAAWRDGTAVHYLLWQNRMATSLAEFIRQHEPGFFSPALTYATLLIEGSLVVLLLFPVWQQRLRPLAFGLIWALHGGIALLCTLGPFSYSMMTFGVLCITPEMWKSLTERLGRGARHTVRFDPQRELQVFGARIAARLDLGRVLDFEEVKGARIGPDEVAKVMRHLPVLAWVAWLTPTLFPMIRALLELARRQLPVGPKPPPRPVFVERLASAFRVVGPAMVLAAVISQLLMENWIVPPAVKVTSRPQWMTDIINYLQVPQGWSMFAPDVPRQDVRLVVDAKLADGTRLDPLTGALPDFDALSHGPWFMNQHWCEVHVRMPGWKHHWRNFRDYLERRIRARSTSSVVSLEVYKLVGDMPAPGSTSHTNVSRELLFGNGPL